MTVIRFCALTSVALAVVGLLASVALAQGAPGSTFRDCDVCPEMVVVPAGSFEMGSPPGEGHRYRDEEPVHRVTIPSPFALGKYEVTRREFAAFVEETGYEDALCGAPLPVTWRNPGFKQTERGPVVCAGWDDAQAYAAWLSGKTGKRYCIPSESEWEYAARAGTATRFWWGDDIGHNNANCWSKDCGDSFANAAPVGSFEANGFGLHDMHGNVWEWVEDCWHKSYSGAPEDGSAWIAGGDCVPRVMRGGSFINHQDVIRSANRGLLQTEYRTNFIGFRVARTLP